MRFRKEFRKEFHKGFHKGFPHLSPHIEDCTRHRKLQTQPQIRATRLARLILVWRGAVPPYPVRPHPFQPVPTRPIAPLLFINLFHPVPSHSIPFHSIPFHPIPSHPIPSHPIPSRWSMRAGCPRKAEGERTAHSATGRKVAAGIGSAGGLLSPKGNSSLGLTAMRALSLKAVWVFMALRCGHGGMVREVWAWRYGQGGVGMEVYGV